MNPGVEALKVEKGNICPEIRHNGGREGPKKGNKVTEYPGRSLLLAPFISIPESVFFFESKRNDTPPIVGVQSAAIVPRFSTCLFGSKARK